MARTRAPARALPRFGPIDTQEPRGAGAQRASASVGSCGRPGLSRSVTGAPPPPPLSRLAACIRARAPAAPRQRSVDTHEPHGAGAARAAASGGRRGPLCARCAPEPSQRRRGRRLYRAWWLARVRQRLYYLAMDLRRPESCAARARGARRPWRGRAAAPSAVPSRHRRAPATTSITPVGMLACTRACSTSAGSY